MNTWVYPDIDLMAVVGHTAAGKTALAAALADRLNGEIISADSRQIYRLMNLGTGKDYQDYLVNGRQIPYHLIDIREPGGKYTLFDFTQDFQKAYAGIRRRGRLPILCGGTGLYVESVLRNFSLEPVPENPELRRSWESLSHEELASMLQSYGPLHNTTDITERPRLIRALEIAVFSSLARATGFKKPSLSGRVFAVYYQREERRARITERLRQRLDNGMVDEVRELLKSVPEKDLIYYGLEYKYLTLYCTGRLSYTEMFEQLNTAIHQFAKRQMTWFRGMEKRGIPVDWIPGELTLEEKLAIILTNERA